MCSIHIHTIWYVFEVSIYAVATKEICHTSWISILNVTQKSCYIHTYVIIVINVRRKIPEVMKQKRFKEMAGCFLYSSHLYSKRYADKRGNFEVFILIKIIFFEKIRFFKNFSFVHTVPFCTFLSFLGLAQRSLATLLYTIQTWTFSSIT